MFERIKAIKNMFSTEPDVDKIDELRGSVVSLSQKRDNVFEDVETLEGVEADLLQQGKDSSSYVTKRRLAAQLSQIRKDLGRKNSLGTMFNRKIDVLNTNIHNLALLQHETVAAISDIDTITENAVKAEELLERLASDAELAAGCVFDDEANEDELAILKEFEEAEPEEEVEPDEEIREELHTDKYPSRRESVKE